MSKIHFEGQTDYKLSAGINTIADAVSVTMGARGLNVMLNREHTTPHITKDGVTVAKAVEMDCVYENMGVRLLQDVAKRTEDEAGDGTTTSIVLSRALYINGLKAIETGSSAVLVKRAIEEGVERVVSYLDKISNPVDTIDDLLYIATISANGDKEIGSLVAQAVEKVGTEGSVIVEEGFVTGLRVEKGMELKKGFPHAHFINNKTMKTAEFNKPYVFLTDGKINNGNDIKDILSVISENKASLVIIAESFSGEFLAQCITNKIQRGLKIACVEAPSVGSNRQSIIEDISYLTGAVISSTTGISLSNIKPEHLGRVDNIIIDKDKTIIKSLNDIEPRLEMIRNEIENAKGSFDIDNAKERLARLQGGIAVITISGETDVEIKEKIDRINDAVCATISGLEEGYVSGGGLALLQSIDTIWETEIENPSKRAGTKALGLALQAPFVQILENAGVNSKEILEITMAGDCERGFNVETGEACNMIDEGIIDPVKVTKTALKNASSIVCLMLTTKVMLNNIEKT